MNELLIEFLGGFTKTNQWSAILPEIMLGVLALALLGAEMALPKNKQTLIPRLAIWGQVIVLLFIIACIGWCNVGESEYFSGLIIQNDMTQIMRAFFVVSSIVVCYLGQIYLNKQSSLRLSFML